MHICVSTVDLCGHRLDQVKIEPSFNWLWALGNWEFSMCKKSEWTLLYAFSINPPRSYRSATVLEFKKPSVVLVYRSTRLVESYWSAVLYLWKHMHMTYDISGFESLNSHLASNVRLLQCSECYIHDSPVEVRSKSKLCEQGPGTSTWYPVLRVSNSRSK